jgi:hypothetical protein
MSEQAAPELGDHVGAQAADLADVGPGGRRLDQDRHGERGDDDGQRPGEGSGGSRGRRGRGMGGHRRDPVDPDADQPRPDQGRDVGDHDQQQDQPGPGPVRAEQILQQAAAPQPQQ